MHPLHSATLVDLEHARLVRQSEEFERRLRSVRDVPPARPSRFAALRARFAPAAEHRDLAQSAEFDGFSCAAERVLAGPMPHGETIILARLMRSRASANRAARTAAFAHSLSGEAALLAGYLRMADAELSEAVEQHRALNSTAAEAHTLLLLARVRFAQGDEAAGHRLLAEALPRSRRSRQARHLVPRVYGAMIAATADAFDARALVATAASVLRVDTCAFCRLAFALPALTACADAGDVAAAHEFEALIWQSSRLWAGTSIKAGVSEALAHLAAAEGTNPLSHLSLAIAAFDSAGQPLDVKRCVTLRRELAAAA